MALTFFRVQEFYESKNKNLLNKTFSVFDFLQEGMDENGIIDYFYFWSGFNLPGDIFRSWVDFEHGSNYFTPLEYDLLGSVLDRVDINETFYVIAAKKGDKITLKHEMAHAMYYVDPAYKLNMDSITIQFKNVHKKQYKKLCKSLSKMGYNKNVYDDEIQAYLSTETKKDLIDDFDVDYSIIKQYVLKYRKTLKKSLINFGII
jgi:hypothetical protein